MLIAPTPASSQGYGQLSNVPTKKLSDVKEEGWGSLGPIWSFLSDEKCIEKENSAGKSDLKPFKGINIKNKELTSFWLSKVALGSLPICQEGI